MRSAFIPLAAATAVSAENLFPSNLISSIFPSTSDSSNNLSGAGFKFAEHSTSRGGKAECVSGIVPVQASTSKNVKFNYQLPENQSQVTETFLDYVTPGANFLPSITAGENTVNGTYKIGATLCVPSDGSVPKSVQLLTHGVGFDRYYWDFTSDYSYVDRAVEAGYAAFFYDRLGVGKSEKADAIDVVQAPLEIEIAHNFATMLKEGCLADKAFDKVIGVGHSFGSIITEAITAQYPSTLDAAILTGFSTNTTALAPFLQGLNLAIANENQPSRFFQLSNGYLVSSNIISQQTGFFRAPGFDPSILKLAELTKGSVTLGELFTQGSAAAPATQYNGSVAVVDGHEDLPFCFGNCSAPANKAQAVKALYAQLPEDKFGTYLAPVCGHGVNFHYAAKGAFDYIMNFLAQQGL
ncbi:alpha/beta-hydrolase [Hortaea werneckii]|nr:alpha/beta-hydrolase [Hortaea werneckii]KAI7323486.1 alpha/beta-hydrolase [Hortaea werneckii]